MDAKAGTRRSQLEAALKGLKDGTLSEQEAAEVMDRLMISQIDELRAELTSADTGSKLLHEAIRSAVAHLTETPTNCTRPRCASVPLRCSYAATDARDHLSVCVPRFRLLARVQGTRPQSSSR